MTLPQSEQRRAASVVCTHLPLVGQPCGPLCFSPTLRAEYNIATVGSSETEHRDRGTTRERKHCTNSTERLHMENMPNSMSDHTHGLEAEQRKRYAVQKIVLQKETQVAAWEAKIKQCKQELADLERNLAQARGELIQAKVQQGWLGARAVGMGGAGAVFSSAAAATSATWTAPASQLSNVFSTL